MDRNRTESSVGALAKRLGLDEEVVRDRVRRKRIPSVAGFVDGERLVPISALSDALGGRKEAGVDRISDILDEDEELTPDRRDAVDLLRRM